MRLPPLSWRFLQLCALLNVYGTLFLDLAKEVPPEIFQQVKRNAPWLVRSLNGSIAEIRLLDEIRRIVTASAATAQCPRLVISGTHEQTKSSWLQRLLINDEQAAKYWDAVLELHPQKAPRPDPSPRDGPRRTP